MKQTRSTVDLVQHAKCPMTNMTDYSSCIICQRQSDQALHNVTLVGLNCLITAAKALKDDTALQIEEDLSSNTFLAEKSPYCIHIAAICTPSNRVMNLLNENTMLERNRQSPKNLSVLQPLHQPEALAQQAPNLKQSSNVLYATRHTTEKGSYQSQWLPQRIANNP